MALGCVGWTFLQHIWDSRCHGPITKSLDGLNDGDGRGGLEEMMYARPMMGMEEEDWRR
jgi:hypothetical protein